MCRHCEKTVEYIMQALWKNCWICYVTKGRYVFACFADFTEVFDKLTIGNYLINYLMLESVNLAQLLLYCTKTVWSTNPVDFPLWCRGMASYRHIEQETESSIPQVVERHSWYHLEGQSQMKKYGKNTSWEGDPRKKYAMAWLCHMSG